MIQGDSVLGLFLARDALPYFKCKIQFLLMNKKNMICTSTKKNIFWHNIQLEISTYGSKQKTSFQCKQNHFYWFYLKFWSWTCWSSLQVFQIKLNSFASNIPSIGYSHQFLRRSYYYKYPYKSHLFASLIY